VVALASILATVLVLRHLGTKPLWLDETVSASVASRPLGSLLAVLPHHDANAGLYYVLLHGWMHVGRTQAWVRGPSAIAFAATAGLAAWLGCRWRGAWAGVAAGLLVSTNRFLLFYGQEARPYSLALLLALASTAALFSRDDGPAPAAYIAATVLLLYVDLFASLFVVAQAGTLAIISWRRRTPLPSMYLRCWAITAAVTVPLGLLMVLNQLSQISWLTRPSLRYLEQTLTGMGGGPVGFAVLGGLAIIALRAGRRRAGEGFACQRLVAPALAASLFAPPIALWLIAQVAPSFIDRYVICSTIALIGLAVLGSELVRRRAGITVAVLILAVPVLVGGQHIAALERQPYKYENPPAVVAFIDTQTKPGDVIGFGGGGLRTVVDTYLRPGVPFPADITLAPGGEATRHHDIYGQEVSSATLEQRLGSVQRLWIVTDPTNARYPTSGPFTAIRSSVTRTFQQAVAASFPGIDVTLYIRRS
jgi:mannosyltransferase